MTSAVSISYDFTYNHTIYNSDGWVIFSEFTNKKPTFEEVAETALKHALGEDWLGEHADIYTVFDEKFLESKGVYLSYLASKHSDHEVVHFTL